MNANHDDPGKRSDPAGVHTNPACSFQTSQCGSDSSSDTDTWFAPNSSDSKPDQGAIPKVKPADTAANSLSDQDKLDRSVILKGQNAPVTEQEKFDRSVISKDCLDAKPDQGAIPKVKPAVGE